MFCHTKDKFKGIECDLSGLNYTISEEGELVAKIKVSGKISYEEDLVLIKEEGKWVIGTEKMAAEIMKSEPAPVEEAHQPEIEEHQEEAPVEETEEEPAEEEHSGGHH